MKKITKDNFYDYINNYVYSMDTNQYAVLGRCYENGFFTSAGLFQNVYAIDYVPAYIDVISSAIDLLPIGWCDLESDHGKIETVRFDIMKELVNMDIPYTTEPCFFCNGNWYDTVRLYLQ